MYVSSTPVNVPGAVTPQPPVANNASQGGGSAQSLDGCEAPRQVLPTAQGASGLQLVQPNSGPWGKKATNLRLMPKPGEDPWQAVRTLCEDVKRYTGKTPRLQEQILLHLNKATPTAFTLEKDSASGRAIIPEIKGARPEGVTQKELDDVLRRASEWGHMEVAVLLCTWGAQYKPASHSGSSVVHWAAKWGAMDILRQAQACGSDLEADGELGYTPLHFAARSGQLDAIDFLTQQGVNVDRPGSYGATPLWLAAGEGHLPAVKLLVAAGAEIDPSTGGTPLEKAAERGHRDVVAYLLEQGASVHGGNVLSPALNAACHNGCVSTVELLLKSKADPQAGNLLKGSTPHSSAGLIGFGGEEIRRLLDRAAAGQL